MIKRTATARFVLGFALTANIGLAIYGCKTTAPDTSELRATNASQYYSSRPDILDIKSAKGKNLIDAWPSIRNAYLHGAANLMALYADHDIFILGRDGEHLYDFMRLMRPKAKNFKLINISRKNMDSPLLMDYLNQQGIDEKSLIKGKKVIIVDTGFDGTIPDYVKSRFSAKARKNLKVQLMISNSSSYPSTWAFLHALDPNALKADLYDVHEKVVESEHLPRFTSRSDSYSKTKDGIVEAVVEDKYSHASGERDVKAARRYMADISAWGKTASTKSLFEKRLKFFRGLLKTGSGLTKAKMKVFLTAQLEKARTNKADLAFVQSAIADYSALTKRKWIKAVHVPLSELKLQYIYFDQPSVIEEIENNPSDHFEKLILARELAIFKKVMREDPLGALESLMETKYGNEEDRTTAYSLVNELLSDFGAYEYQEAMETIISNGDKALIRKFFTEQIGLKIKQKDYEAMNALLAALSFTQEKWSLTFQTDLVSRLLDFQESLKGPLNHQVEQALRYYLQSLKSQDSKVEFKLVERLLTLQSKTKDFELADLLSKRYFSYEEARFTKGQLASFIYEIGQIENLPQQDLLLSRIANSKIKNNTDVFNPLIEAAETMTRKKTLGTRQKFLAQTLPALMEENSDDLSPGLCSALKKKFK